MGIAFFERMAGTLTCTESGKQHLVEFQVKCENRSLLNAAQSGHARLSGVVSARPWVGEAALDGSLVVSLFRDRSITYDLGFTNESGQDLRLKGRKSLHWRKRLFGMTRLEVELSSQDEILARGTLTFDVHELPSFVTSVTPFTSFEAVDIEGTSRFHAAPSAHSPSPLDPGERAIARALAEALITPGERVPAVNDESIDRAEAVLACMSPHVLSGYRHGLAGLDLVARFRSGRGFAELSPSERESLIEALQSVAGPSATKVLTMPLEAGHFGRKDYLEAIEADAPTEAFSEPDERWMNQVMSPDDLDESSTIPCDVVIVGTGAGGAPLAAQLAKRGYAVAMIEEGHYYRRPDFAGAPEERLARFWRDGGMNVAIGNSGIVVPTGRMVGGSTAINSGTCFDTPDGVLREWLDQGFPSDFEPENFRRYLDKTREVLGVEPAQRPWLGAIADRVAEGAEALAREGFELEHGPLPRNAPGCDGQGLCAFGCPTGAKRSADVSWVPMALDAGAFCFTGMSVKRLLTRGNRVAAIEARGQDSSGAQRTLRIKARAVVLAAGTLETPMLLANNGIDLPRLGKGLSVHPALGALARFEDSLGAPWNAIPQSYGVEGLVDERVRFEGFTSPPSLTAPTLPFHGAELTRWMDQLDHVGQYGFMVRDHNDGQVRRGPNGRPLILKSVSNDVLELFKRGSAVLAELLLRGGAAEVATGIAGVGNVETIADARAISTAPVKARDFRSMAFHPLGTCAMGANARSGVVDFNHRVFGTQNLYVVDGSSVPTSLGVNPQVTIMSMALRAADVLSAQL